MGYRYSIIELMNINKHYYKHDCEGNTLFYVVHVNTIPHYWYLNYKLSKEYSKALQVEVIEGYLPLHAVIAKVSEKDRFYPFSTMHVQGNYLIRYYKYYTKIGI